MPGYTKLCTSKSKNKQINKKHYLTSKYLFRVVENLNKVVDHIKSRYLQN